MTRIAHEQAHHYLHAGPDPLDAAERAELDTHLAGCPQCQAYAAEVASFWPALTRALHARLDALPPSPGLARRVQAQVGGRPALWRLRKLAGPMVTAGVGVAAIVVLVFLLFATGPFGDGPQSASAPASASATLLPGLAVFGDRIVLAGFEVAPAPLFPGSTLSLTVRWQVAPPLDTAYATFVQVLDANSNLVVQSDNIPGLDTSLTTAAEVVDHHIPMLPDDLAAGQYQLAVGVYDTTTGNRLRASDNQEIVPLTTIQVRPIQHRVADSFGDVGTLLGFDLANDRPSPGGTIELTLYWRARSQPTTDYLISVQIMDANRSIVAQTDGVPGDGAHPTSSWQTNDIIIDPHTVQLPAGLPPGSYTVMLSMFDPASGTPVLTGAGDGALALTTLEIQEPGLTPGPTPTAWVSVTGVTFSPDPAAPLDRSAGFSLGAELTGYSANGSIVHFLGFPTYAGETPPDCSVRDVVADRIFWEDQWQLEPGPPSPFTRQQSFTVSSGDVTDAVGFVMRVSVIEPVAGSILFCQQQVYRLALPAASLTPTATPLPASPTPTLAFTTTPPPASWTPFPTVTPAPPPSPTPPFTPTPTPQTGESTPPITSTPPPTPADSPTPFPTFTPTP